MSSKAITTEDMEDISFQENVSIVLNYLIGFSTFWTKIHELLYCELEVCEIGEFFDKFNFFKEKKKTVDKTNIFLLIIVMFFLILLKLCLKL